jgi:hypothetical protein
VRCLSESSIDCEINLWKMELNVDKGVIWLPYKILNHFKCTNCQNLKEAKDGSDIRLMSNFGENL